MIQLHDKHFIPFISHAELDAAITRMAQEIENETGDDVPVFVGVLNGAFMLASDLLKKFSKNCEISFVKLSSYEGMATTHEVKELIGLNQNLEGRTVIIIEDIVDTGNTLVEIKKILESKKIHQLKIATLFFKPEAYTKDIKLDYVGFEIPNKFIVGYGLDYDGLGRNLPEVYQLK